MKRYITLCIIAALCSATFAQGTHKDSIHQREPEISFDGESPFNDIYIPAPQERSLDNILWKKTVWRVIDMREQVNFPLYYPLKESNGRMNLFLTIFNLLKEGKVNAYEYFPEKEEFTKETKFPFSRVITETDISVVDSVVNNNGNITYIIDDVDVPNDSVLQFFIKEVWYFDAMESCMKFKIEAIAPRLNYFDTSVKKRQTKMLYWIPFDDLRPWLAKQPVVINNMNSTSFISYDDLFQKRHFSGHIYKEDNIQNRELLDYCFTPEQVRNEQKRIESEIMNFESDLWEY